MDAIFHTRACRDSGEDACQHMGCYAIATGEPVEKVSTDTPIMLDTVTDSA